MWRYLTGRYGCGVEGQFALSLWLLEFCVLCFKLEFCEGRWKPRISARPRLQCLERRRSADGRVAIVALGVIRGILDGLPFVALPAIH